MKLKITCALFAIGAALLAGKALLGGGAVTTIADPSFEEPQPKNRFGMVFAKWGGWIYEGECEFRVSDLAHTGKHSMLMVGGSDPKIRTWPEPKLTLPPGRYRVSAYLRGLDIGEGRYGATTEFMFAGNYMPLKKNGTFGWTKMIYVGEIKDRREEAHPSFGLMAPGYLWVDDVRLDKVGPEVPLTPTPIFLEEETRVAPREPIGRAPIPCPDCGYRNNASWDRCYACGSSLERPASDPQRPAAKLITSFEENNPFGSGTRVAEHASDGKFSLRVNQGFISLDAPQNWLGFEMLKVDVFTAAKDPIELNIEVKDHETRDYWTRVNRTTVIPPGRSTITMPTSLYVGEKSRPGRALLRDKITRLVFALGDKIEAPVYFDNLRLERDTETEKVRFPELFAFDVGPAGSPLMEGFTPLDASRIYNPGRGYGWKNAKIWRGYNVLQPDPLYQDFLCVEKGGLAIDVPNGKYHVFVNMDSPSGYWGEVQRYTQRALILEGTRYEDRMNAASFRAHYYRSYGIDDRPGDDPFDTYLSRYFKEKYYVVDVRDGQLNIDFEGSDWACCVSAIIVFPDAKEAAGQKFLQFVRERRQWHYSNTFKPVQHTPSGDEPSLNEAEKQRGFVPFERDYMSDVYYNDRPLPDERVETLKAQVFAGEMEPIALSVWSNREKNLLTVRVTDLQGPGSAIIPAEAVRINPIEHRVTRIAEGGYVYAIKPRWLLPTNSAQVVKDLTRTFWLTIRPSEKAMPGIYRGSVSLTSREGGEMALPLEVTVLPGTLDAVDIPVGPWGHTIDSHWFEDESRPLNDAMAELSLQKLREYGFTTASGLPVVSLQGFQNGRPLLDFSVGDRQMVRFRKYGFKHPVITYCPLPGLDLYYQDRDRLQSSGYRDYSQMIQAIFGAAEAHGRQAGWLPVYWNIADEPVGDDLTRSAENAEAYRKAFPSGPPYFTGASSFEGSKTSDPHFRLSKALHVANWASHDEDSIRTLQSAGGKWAFYNEADRYTYGIYLYKAAKEKGMQFRLAWHWNNCAGDPYYALDCREEDFAWCNTSPDGTLVPSLLFERLREGLDDYRRLITLKRLIRENPGRSADAEKVLNEIVGPVRMGQRDADPAAFARWRAKLDAAIVGLR